MNKPLGVIFDMDGVLVNSYQPHFLSWRQAAVKIGLELKEPDFARTFGRTSREIIAHLWPGKMDDAAIARFDLGKEAAYREILRVNFPAMEGAGHLIQSLSAAGFKLAIGSSGPPENVAVVKEQLPNGNLISATVDGMQVKHGKPDPEVFLTAAQKIDVAPERCAVIEDALAGIEAARRAGMAAIALTGTATREALSERAHLVVDSLNELSPEIIANLIRKVAA